VSVLTALSVAGAALVVPPALYLGLLALLARRLPIPRPPPPGRWRFAFLIPAHNEELSVAATVRSILAVDYPAAARRVFVVAHNCGDRTAAEASRAGAEVLVFNAPDRATKGDAVAHGVSRILSESRSDALVVVDADTLVQPNILSAFAARLARGFHAVQAEYAVRNVDASWRTRLLTVGLAMFHRTRSLARERMGASAGLRGNGMCFSRGLLTMHPPRARSLVEDVEYGIELGLAGHRVVYAHETSVYGEMAASGSAAASQRRRWEVGRLQLALTHAPRLIGHALVNARPMCLDLAIDLMVPPLAYLGLGLAVGLGLETARVASSGSSMLTALWLLAVLASAAYLARGIQYSGLGMRALSALAYAPVYLVWKLVAVRPAAGKGWVRTRREAEDGAPVQE
jgi:1,2-diacylglycerol 3-beta-glucosyltransferase